MNSRAVSLSLAMAVLAVMFVQSYVSSFEDQQKKQFGEQVLVAVAKKDINEMETINRSHFELKSIPKAFRQPASIYFEKSQAEDVKNKALENLVGNVALVPIRKDEQITYNKITQPSVRTGLAPQIAPGRRAVSIPVSEVSGVGKLLKPGDRLDVIMIADVPGAVRSKIGRTLIQDVVVLAVGKYISNNPARKLEVDPNSGKEKVFSLTEDMIYPNVVIEVDPVQAQTLALLLSDNNNQVYLSLRNNDDTERLNLPGVTQVDLLGPDVGRVNLRVPSGGSGVGGAN